MERITDLSKPLDIKKIHPDFQLNVVSFMQNKPWDRSQTFGRGPEIKSGFSFDDTSLLTNCPFVTKISFDLRGAHTYFGVSYGLEEDLDELVGWSQQFPSAKLFTYHGEFIAKIV